MLREEMEDWEPPEPEFDEPPEPEPIVEPAPPPESAPAEPKAEPPAAPTTPPAPPPAEEPKPAEPVKSEEPPTAEPVAAPVEAAKQEPAVTPLAEAPATGGPLSPADTLAQLTEHRAVLEEKLATEHFKLNDDMVELMDTDPSLAVSKIASKVYLDAVTGLYGQFVNQLPGMIEQTLASRAESSAITDRFFESWPQLQKADQAHVQTIARIAQVYKGMNPQATPDQYIKDVGLHAMAKLGLALQPAVAPTAQPAVVAPAAFQPAATAAPSGGNPPPQDPNPFASINNQLIFEDN